MSARSLPIQGSSTNKKHYSNLKKILILIFALHTFFKASLWLLGQKRICYLNYHKRVPKVLVTFIFTLHAKFCLHFSQREECADNNNSFKMQKLFLHSVGSSFYRQCVYFPNFVHFAIADVRWQLIEEYLNGLGNDNISLSIKMGWAQEKTPVSESNKQ